MEMDNFKDSVQHLFFGTTDVNPLLRILKLGYDWKINSNETLFRSWFFFNGDKYGAAIDFHQDIEFPDTLLDSIKRKMETLIYHLEKNVQILLESPPKDAKELDPSHEWTEVQAPNVYKELCGNCELGRQWQKDENYPFQQKGEWEYLGEHKPCPTLKGLAEEVELRLSRKSLDPPS